MRKIINWLLSLFPENKNLKQRIMIESLTNCPKWHKNDMILQNTIDNSKIDSLSGKTFFLNSVVDGFIDWIS